MNARPTFCRRREEQVRRAHIRFLVAQVLADPLFNLFLAALHLDHGEGYPVHEQHNVWPDSGTLWPLDGKLGCHVKGVRAHVRPADVAERPFARLTFNCLWQGERSRCNAFSKHR
jgi:hypothetical protein